MSEKPTSSRRAEHALPRWAVKLLQRLVPLYHRDVVLGDFAEIYRSIAVSRGRARALRWYWGQVLKSTPAFFANGIYFGGDMFRNYLKIALRSLNRRKFYAALNIGGLAVGLAACLLIFQYVAFERSYDTFHEDQENLYRVTVTGLRGGEVQTRTAFSWSALAPLVQQNVPEVRAAARLHPNYSTGTIAYTDAAGQRHALREEGITYVDPSFLDLYTFPLLRGDPATALTEPHTLLITESAAQRYFKDADPIGQTLDVRAWGDGTYTITGVLADVPANSYFQFDFLLPLDDILQDEHGQYHDRDGWSWTNFATHLRLHPDADVAAVEEKVAALINEAKRESYEEANLRVTVHLQPLTDIHLYSDFDEDWGALGNYKTVYFFTLVALFILLIAWVNYVNLSTARAVERAKEVGVRKVAGARRGQVVLQFLFESALVNGLALAFAVGLAVLGLPYLNDLAGTTMTTSIWTNPWFWGVFLGIFVAGVLTSSLYPAFILSAFKPVTVLKGSRGTAASRQGLRKVLVVFQFAASIALFIGTYAAFTQVTYMRTLDLGIDIDRMLVIQRPSIVEEEVDFVEQREVLKAELAAFPAISAVTTSTSVPGGGFNLGTTAQKEGAPATEREEIHGSWINYNFVDTYGLQLAAGRNFSEEQATDHEEAILINETAVQTFGYASAEAALGQRILVGHSSTFTIVGVLEDFNWMTVKQEVAPYFFMPTRGGRYYSLKVNTANLDETLAAIQATYDAVFPGNPFDYFFVDRFFDEQYKAEQQFGTLFGLFALFAVFVACLGLVGLAAFTAAQRTKEIGVRKVLGASAPTIARLLLLDFGKLVLVALVLTVPLAYFALETWLADFAARIDLTVGLFLLPGLAVVLVALLTVSYHPTRAALTNPVDSLRYE